MTLPPLDDDAQDAAAPDEAPAGQGRRLSLADSVVQIAAPGPEPHVWALLDKAKAPSAGPDGGDRYYPKRTPSNVHYVLSQDSRWLGRVRTNDFDGGLYLDGAPVEDRHLTEIVHWLERVYSLQTNEDRVARTLLVVGDEHRYHPVREWLSSLEWDGAPRVERLLDFYLGATPGPGVGAPDADAPSMGLLAALGRYWMVSCVARIMDPGCKVDTTLILVGKQGARKSTACRILANAGRPVRGAGGARTGDGWFSDTLIDLHTKDLYESLQGVWIYELAELDAFNRADWSRIKAILSSPDDRWRRPYGRSVQSRARQCVFIGTTNQDQFLGDPTGSRRFWPVRVGEVQIERLQEDVGQLWAEAVALYRSGAPWWLRPEEDTELARVSAEYAITHPWASLVSGWLLQQGDRDVSTAEVLIEVVKKEPGHWTRNDEGEVGGILRRLGYSRVRRRTGGARVWVWSRRGGDE